MSVAGMLEHTVFVKKEDIAAVQVNGMSSAETGHCISNQLEIAGKEADRLQPPPTTITRGAGMSAAIVYAFSESRGGR